VFYDGDIVLGGGKIYWHNLKNDVYS
jgi:hypothetical protein